MDLWRHNLAQLQGVPMTPQKTRTSATTTNTGTALTTEAERPVEVPRSPDKQAAEPSTPVRKEKTTMPSLEQMTTPIENAMEENSTPAKTPAPYREILLQECGRYLRQGGVLGVAAVQSFRAQATCSPNGLHEIAYRVGFECGKGYAGTANAGICAAYSRFQAHAGSADTIPTGTQKDLLRGQ
eukprot:g364.t1